jgi:hypothetical protein
MSASRPIIRDNRELSIVASVGQTSFAWAKPLFDALDLEVAVSLNAAPFVVQTSGVTVTPAADKASATIVFATAPRTSAGDVVVVRLRGARVHERVANITRGGAISSSAIEDELDRQTITLQDQQAQLQRLLDTQVLLDFDAAGPLAARTTYNTAAAKFVFLQTDDARLRPVYFVKLSATSGDWSGPLIPAGADGADGEDGADGVAMDYPVVAGGSANALTATLPGPAFTLDQLPGFYVHATAANTSPTVTFKPNALPTKPLVKGNDLPLVPGDIAGLGHVLSIDYSAGLDKYVLANPATGIAPPAQPRTGVRQTAQAGPANAAGAPSYMPASAGALALATTGLDTTSLIVSAAMGHDLRGPLDRIGLANANLSWSGLANNTTVFGGVTVNTNGTVTEFSTALAPLYTFANAPSTAAGQYTFVIPLMKMFLGNGTTANEVAAVFLWEAITAAGVVSSVTPYAYNGVFEETGASAIAINPSVAHNLGVATGVLCQFALVCASAEAGYAQGEAVVNIGTTSSANIESLPWLFTRNRAAVRAGNHGTNTWRAVNASTGATAILTASNWRHRFTVRRAW